MNNVLKIILILALFGFAAIIQAHVNNSKLPEGCGSCHVGHGKTNEPMLSQSEEDFCYQCHGSDMNQSAMKSEGKLDKSVTLANIESEFKKQYHHPVTDGFGHKPDEVLPSATGTKVNHAECVDCHNPHQRITIGEKQTYEVKGYSLSGQYLDISTNEYEICFKCHIDKNAIESTPDNAYKEFSVSYLSQHPVTKPSSRNKSISLNKALGTGGLMKCSDCHTNDNPDGPKGPHGSNYRFLLSGNYNIDTDIDESPYAYQFCYSCHERSSILANESFPRHREHIIGNPIKGISGTSCYTCHASHSSKANNHLIKFNLEAVKRNSSGLIQYISTGNNSGECYLSCHGYDHNPAKY